MQNDLVIYNTLTRQKEKFEPISPPHVGLYVCGPTVYSNVHLGNCRTFTSFDIIYRYLTYLKFKVRYVRNITDVGHLVNDADEGEDKIAKKAKLENLEPMEVVQKYANDFHSVMSQLNNLSPSIEPYATGHIVEQIEMTRLLIKKGYAYEVNGSVYFDISKYNQGEQYGKLSGRITDDLLAGQRALEGQEEKRSSIDFALWKKANKEHIMKWESPWGEGFPGWHLECSAMSSKYLGNTFDIHGGGMDLKFPHHECEIAQSKAVHGIDPCKYWVHTNMLTINGDRMGKSKGNSILPNQLFTGDHPLLTQAYSPMTLRFCMLQTHYRSTMDISNEALQAAGKGYKRIINGLKSVKDLTYRRNEDIEINENLIDEISASIKSCYQGLNDDFNTAVAIAGLFNLLKKINSIVANQINISTLTEESFNSLKDNYIAITERILGLKEEKPSDFNEMLALLLNLYKKAKANREFDRVDEIRAGLKQVGVVVKDMKTGIDWAYEE